jgi:hypothetical protein
MHDNKSERLSREELGKELQKLYSGPWANAWTPTWEQKSDPATHCTTEAANHSDEQPYRAAPAEAEASEV